jgi:hypothetical protein
VLFNSLVVLLLLPGVAVSQNAGCRCGVSTAVKIVGGVNAIAQEFPWQVGNCQFFSVGKPTPVCLYTVLKDL